MPLTLKAARINKGLTQEKAAAKIGISVFTLGNYERGKSYPDVPVIKAIEATYDVKYADIIFLPENYPLRVKQEAEHKSTG